MVHSCIGIDFTISSVTIICCLASIIDLVHARKEPLSGVRMPSAGTAALSAPLPPAGNSPERWGSAHRPSSGAGLHVLPHAQNVTIDNETEHFSCANGALQHRCLAGPHPHLQVLAGWQSHAALHSARTWRPNRGCSEQQIPYEARRRAALALSRRWCCGATIGQAVDVSSSHIWTLTVAFATHAGGAADCRVQQAHRCRLVLLARTRR
jgi:hypothetical protein